MKKERIDLSVFNPNYKIKRIYETGVHLETRILPQDYDFKLDAELCADTLNADGSITDNRFFGIDVRYNHMYPITHDKCIGDYFYIVKAYKAPRSKNKNYKSKLTADVFKIQTFAFTVMRIGAKKLKSGNIFDPYYRTLFSGYCAIGNVKWDSKNPLDTTANEIYKSWVMMMSRCYDSKDPYYSGFGAIGVVPLYPKWNFFEFFLSDNLALLKRGCLPLVDYNDPSLYMPPSNICEFSLRTKREFLKIPYAKDYVPSVCLPGRLRDMELDKRTAEVLKTPGRPATGRRRKKLMYKLLPEG